MKNYQQMFLQLSRLLFCVVVFLAVVPPTIHANERHSKGNYLNLVCEGQIANLTCGPGKVIKVTRANYGRFGMNDCNEEGKVFLNTQCKFADSFRIANEMCGGKQKCHIPVNNEAFGADPCRETSKYLEIQHECEEQTTTVPLTTTPKPKPRPKQTEKPMLIDPRPKEIVTPPPTEPPAPVPQTEKTVAIKYCPAVRARDLDWPQTELGHEARVACPNNDRSAHASWMCAVDGQWSPKAEPNLSHCVSTWARRLQTQATQVSTGEQAVSLARMVADDAAANELYGGDIIAASDTLVQLVAKTRSLLSRTPVHSRKPVAVDLSQKVVSAANTMLQVQNDRAWRDLPPSKRVRSANDVIDSVEMNAKLIAESMRGTQGPHTQDESNVFVEVTSVQVQDYAQFPSHSLYNTEIDSVRVPRQALQQAARLDRVNLVYASFDRVGEYMKPEPRFLTIKQETIEVERAVVSKVISANVGTRGKIKNLKQPAIITMATHQTSEMSNPQCAFWDKSLRPAGQWSTQGCKVVAKASNRSHTVCECDHLTNFAILMDVRGLGFGYTDHLVLSTITYIGCVISIICLVLSIFAFFIMRGVNTDRVIIHINLCICLLIAELIFIFGIPQVGHKIVCGVIAGCLHYFFLASFAWMLLEGFQLYALLVEVFEAERSRKIYYFLFGYGVPAIIVGISAGVDYTSYGTEDYCWLRTDNYFILAFIVPVLVVLTMNFIFLGWAIVVICRHVNFASGYRHCQHSRTTIENIGVWLKGACVLVFLLGLTWIFGFLYVNDRTKVMAYLFTILNSLQGLFIFVFHVVMNDKARKEYHKWVLRNDWLPRCVREPTLVDFKPNHDPHKHMHTSSSSGQPSATSPLPPDSMVTSQTDGMLKLAPKKMRYQVKPYTKQSTLALDHRYNSEAQWLARQGSFNTGRYEYIQYPANELKGSDNSEFCETLEGMVELPPVPVSRPPPPSYPPPAPPSNLWVDAGSPRGDTLVVFDFSSPSPASTRLRMTNHRWAGDGLSNQRSVRSAGEDSAYSGDGSFVSGGAVDSTAHLIASKAASGRSSATDFIGRDLSGSPESLTGSASEEARDRDASQIPLLLMQIQAKMNAQPTECSSPAQVHSNVPYETPKSMSRSSSNAYGLPTAISVQSPIYNRSQAPPPSGTGKKQPPPPPLRSQLL